MLKSLEQENPDSTIWVEKLTPHFFFLLLTQLKNGKSVGPFSIPCNLLKMLNKFISPILALLINESFLTGVFPDKLKIAKVIALHKKGATDIPSSYRPISLLSIFSKIF